MNQTSFADQRRLMPRKKRLPDWLPFVSLSLFFFIADFCLVNAAHIFYGSPRFFIAGSGVFFYTILVTMPFIAFFCGYFFMKGFVMFLEQEDRSPKGLH